LRIKYSETGKQYTLEIFEKLQNKVNDKLAETDNGMKVSTLFLDESKYAGEKYSPRTFKNIKMSSFLHFLFYIAVISGVTRDLSQGGKFYQKGPTGH